MFVIENTFKVKKGYGDKLEAKFTQMGQMEKVPGFIDVNLLRKRVKQEEDHEVMIIWSKWESQKAHTTWSSSEMFRKTHEGARSEYILESKIAFYDVVSFQSAGSIEEQNQDAV